MPWPPLRCKTTRKARREEEFGWKRSAEACLTHHTTSGTHIMVAGIVMQLFSMLVFCALAILFYTR